MRRGGIPWDESRGRGRVDEIALIAVIAEIEK